MGLNRLSRGGGATRKHKRRSRARTRLSRHHRSHKRHKKKMYGGSSQSGGSALAEALVPLGLLTGLFMTKKRRSTKNKTARRRRR